MGEGAFSGEPVVPATPTSPEPGAQGSAESEAPGSAEPEVQGSAGRKVLFLAVGLLVIGIPLCVGILAFMNPPVAATEVDASADGALADNSGSDTKSENVAFADPLWTRPEWADAMEGMTAFELPAATDVLFGNGRLRPTLGVTCSREGTAVHIVTGGTALVDPQTSGHVVHLTFDDVRKQSQQWTAADDMRALFAPAPQEIAYQISQSTRLSFGFSHYMSGPIVVEFDLRGADAVIDSMAEPCGWTAD